MDWIINFILNLLYFVYNRIYNLFVFLVGTNVGSSSINRSVLWIAISAIGTVSGFIAVWLQLRQLKKNTTTSIRPQIIATRLSKDGEVGIFAGEEGKNTNIYVINVGVGHAHKVNVRLFPPATAYYVNDRGVVEFESAIYAFHELEMPSNAKRMWNKLGGLCTPSNNWHYMYAEYEDVEQNAYYTMQSGYATKTGRIEELKRKRRKSDDDSFWDAVEGRDWLDDIDVNLKKWADKQKINYENRTKK